MKITRRCRITLSVIDDLRILQHVLAEDKEAALLLAAGEEFLTAIVINIFQPDNLKLRVQQRNDQPAVFMLPETVAQHLFTLKVWVLLAWG